jgi:hypothetical protein
LLYFSAAVILFDKQKSPASARDLKLIYPNKLQPAEV